jgi:hypothetical protein
MQFYTFFCLLRPNFFLTEVLGRRRHTNKEEATFKDVFVLFIRGYDGNSGVDEFVNSTLNYAYWGLMVPIS